MRPTSQQHHRNALPSGLQPALLKFMTQRAFGHLPDIQKDVLSELFAKQKVSPTPIQSGCRPQHAVAALEILIKNGVPNPDSIGVPPSTCGGGTGNID
jgi:hypothetical protein